MATTKKCARYAGRFSYGLYRRHEIIHGISEGMLIKFDKKSYYKINPIAESVARSFEQITGKKERKIKLENVKPHTFVRFAGYRNGEPFVTVQNAKGKVVTISAFGYVVAEGEMKGRNISQSTPCSEQKMHETTI